MSDMSKQPSGRTPLIAKVVAKAGSVKAVAQAVGLTPQAVSLWTQIPTDKIEAIEQLTGIPAAELRPDLAKLFQQVA